MVDEKAEGAKVKPELKEAIHNLMKTGGWMSNICFNVAQQERPITPKDREIMREKQKEWDKSEIELRALLDKNKVRK